MVGKNAHVCVDSGIMVCGAIGCFRDAQVEVKNGCGHRVCEDMSIVQDAWDRSLSRTKSKHCRVRQNGK